MKYYVINVPFFDWKIHFRHNSNITYVDTINSIDLSQNFKIIPICPNDFVRYDATKLMFFTNPYSIAKLNNKGLFAEFMMKYFESYIPLTLYYNVNNKYIYNSGVTKPSMILKSTIGAGGINVKIIKDSDFLENIGEFKLIKNIVVSEYITYDVIYSGHILTIGGVLIDKIYFYLDIPVNQIYRGRIRNYKVSDKLPCDDSIFMKILTKLNYSGFVCVDFTISNNKIFIFEINPRMGGSLVFNIIYFNRFFSKLIKYYNGANFNKIKN